MPKTILNQKLFIILFASTILLAFFERILPATSNNFYFTMDQGNDAVYVREILERGQILLKGPETDIEGLYAGPLWYYFLAIGYKLFGGHPFGGLFVLIVLNVLLTGIIVWKVSREVSKLWGIMIGIALQLSWGFYDTSRYAFNPFVLVFLSFVLILILIEFMRGKTRNYILAGVPVGLGFHVEVAGALAIFIFYFLIGLWSILKKRITPTIFFWGLGFVSLFFIPHLISEAQSRFSQLYALLREFKNSEGAFSTHSLTIVTPYFLHQISQTVFPQKQEIGIFISLIVIGLTVKKWLKEKRPNLFVKHFFLLTTMLLVITWIFFAGNNGWRDWQTVFIYPLLFVSVLLLVSQLKKEVGIVLFTIILVSSSATFVKRYSESFKRSDDPSILANEIQAIDWIYQESDGKGFYVYSYLPSVLDYPYQYLFWWHGNDKYGYVPCEYSSYPGTQKILYFPANIKYENPQKECMNLRFLIIEPDRKNPTLREQWLSGTSEGTQILGETQIGEISVEKRKILKIR